MLSALETRTVGTLLDTGCKFVSKPPWRPAKEFWALVMEASFVMFNLWALASRPIGRCIDDDSSGEPVLLLTGFDCPTDIQLLEFISVEVLATSHKRGSTSSASSTSSRSPV